MNKRQHGIYYISLFNPFSFTPFIEWIKKHHLEKSTVLEPFAGCNSIINMLQKQGFAKQYKSYDIYPQNNAVEQHDSITYYPRGYELCITNPPWLYKSSAQRRGLSYPNTEYDDVYKLCISLALQHNRYVGVFLPASFIQSGLFRDKVERIIFLNKPLFKDTDSPVCLALFNTAKHNTDIELYNDNEFIGTYDELLKHLPAKSKNTEDIVFNVPDGALGLIAIDNNKTSSIRFCKGTDLEHYKIRSSSRSITRISGVSSTTIVIDTLNACIENIRKKTQDVFLTTFKGLRADGKYRRRLDYKLARDIIHFVK